MCRYCRSSLPLRYSFSISSPYDTSRPGWDGSCLLLSEDIRDHIGTALLGSLVQMGMDVGNDKV